MEQHRARTGRAAARTAGSRLDELETEIVSACDGLRAIKARLLRLIGEFDRRRGYLDYGRRSTAEWLVWRCGFNIRTARDHVAVAIALRRLTRISDAFSKGRLSYSQVRAICRVATTETEEELLEAASRLSTPEIEALVRRTRQAQAEVDPAVTIRRRSVRVFDDPDEGMGVLVARLPRPEIRIVWNAILAAHRRRGGSTAPVDETHPDAAPAHEQRFADALVDVCRGSVSGSNGAGGRTGRRADQVGILVHLDAEDGELTFSDGTPIGRPTAERMLCEAIIASLKKGKGRRLELGRSTSRVPPALRKAILGRDRHCQYPGCRADVYLDVHHELEWTNGGPTNPANLVALCSFHHMVVHEGGHTLFRADDGRIRARTPGGRVITSVPGKEHAHEMTAAG